MISLIVPSVLLISCSSLGTPDPPATIKPLVTIEHVKPPILPPGLIEYPKAESEILHNSVVYEFGMYRWIVYTLALEYKDKQMPAQLEAVLDELNSMLADYDNDIV